MTGRQAAVFGSPIGHSRSPQLHRAAYAALGAEIGYRAIEADASRAGEVASMLRSGAGWAGASVTMPLKQALVPHMDRLSARVRTLGALNTVVVVPDDAGARLVGENTDVDGIVRALRGAGLGECSAVLVVGAGGTAAAAAAAAAELGARGVDFAVRSPARAADALAVAGALGLDASAVPVDDAGGRLAPYDAVVSTLPPGAADGFAGTLPARLPRPGTVLLDVVYDPWPTALAGAWQGAGGAVVSGLSMLVHQAVEQALLFTGAGPGRRAEVTNVMCDAVGLPRPRS